MYIVTATWTSTTLWAELTEEQIQNLQKGYNASTKKIGLLLSNEWPVNIYISNHGVPATVANWTIIKVGAKVPIEVDNVESIWYITDWTPNPEFRILS